MSESFLPIGSEDPYAMGQRLKREEERLNHVANEFARLKAIEGAYEQLLTMVVVVSEHDPIRNEYMFKLTPFELIAGKSWAEILRDHLKWIDLKVEEEARRAVEA